ncbi:bifunctional riboflavin kinase/FAD synthetase [Anaerosporobacter faecicola]|uniref:bifunctional riboflavin kinase/FAD synthetase n=1 Tax=Anaerosporobacter faecicola TaxID=2718714 RepID=UPI001439EA56|nr:bifunctional riboflavin kinase/FAD synthetase [Anaerosporobacter faecicola]
MRYITDKMQLNLDSDTIVTLGKFDGIHIGHQLLIDEVKKGSEHHWKSVVFTFTSVQKLRKDKVEGNLLSEEEKKAYLDQLGIDVLISYPFDEEMRCMEADTFVSEILCKQLRAKKIVVGSDFEFGYKRKGNATMLQEWSEKYGFEVVVLEKVKIDDQIVSSTAIRKNLLSGQIEQVNRMLGRTYQIGGTVVYGNQIGGKLLSMPTANIYPAEDKLLPPNGVYATIVHTSYGMYQAITNIGYKPTIGGETKPGVESYLFDFNGDLYGQEIQVDFYTYERGEQKFDGLEALKAQMFCDREFGKQYFAKQEQKSMLFKQ